MRNRATLLGNAKVAYKERIERMSAKQLALYRKERSTYYKAGYRKKMDKLGKTPREPKSPTKPEAEAKACQPVDESFNFAN